MWWSRPLTFVNAHVVGPEGQAWPTLRIVNRRLDGAGVAPAADDAVIDAGGAFIFPGLINAHDHLELNSQPRLKWHEVYANAREWVADFQPRFATDPDLAVNRPDTLDDRLWVGGLKNLLSGVTTVGHHNPIHRALRRRFPVRVVRRFGFSHSLLLDGPSVRASHRETPPDWPWLVHAAEGVDEEARREIATLHELGCLTPNTVLIHGVALCAAGIDRVLGAGAGLVWCPSSNEFLFGRTADVRRFDDADRLGLGTDSRLSGAGDLLDELKAAHATRQLSPEGLARAVTRGAARLLRINAGRIEPGVPADLALVRASSADPFEALVSAARTDVCLTMVDGRPAVATPELAAVYAATRTSALPASIDGQPRLVARWIAHKVARLSLREPGFEVAQS
jgi:cytosine/adenosine deaminase-related metal-dependent hydrolase